MDTDVIVEGMQNVPVGSHLIFRLLTAPMCRAWLRRVALPIVAAMCLAACGGAPEQTSEVFAYSGAANLQLREDLSLDAPISAKLRQGERVEVLELRRRFARVLTESGATGWVDTASLMTASEIEDLNRLTEVALSRPPQGEATVLDTLNVHTGPYRTAPSFTQLHEGDVIQVVDHRVSLRNSGPRPLPKSVPRGEGVSASPLAADEDEPLPDPMPHPPLLPAHWQKISVPRLRDLPGYRNGRPRSAADDWLLVLTPDGQAGWVLMRMVFSMVPDQVGRYAEGSFVMSYFPLSQVFDPERGESFPNYVWATSSYMLQPSDFDSFRVFSYSTRRHRYETAYRQNNLRGHYPVELVDLPDSDDPAFSIIAENDDGELTKDIYAFNGSRVRRVQSEPYKAPAPVPEVRLSDTFDVVKTPVEQLSWSERLRVSALDLFKSD